VYVRALACDSIFFSQDIIASAQLSGPVYLQLPHEIVHEKGQQKNKTKNYDDLSIADRPATATPLNNQHSLTYF
jgi:hypothetical protein